MATPQLSRDQIQQVSTLLAQYISQQREQYASRAMPLSPEQTRAMDGFFSRELLGRVRLLVLRKERVGNPGFYPLLESLGFRTLPDQATMAAITFSDVVISHGPISDATLFHELVHVEQYRQLGIPRFAELYVRGFLTCGEYEKIPLEVNAYTLGGRFEQDPESAFSVTDAVRIWNTEGRL